MKDIKILKGKRQVLFLINCTQFEDYDIIAVGKTELLKKLGKSISHTHFIKKSVLGVPLLVVDTFDTISDAKKYVKEIYKKYATLIIKP